VSAARSVTRSDAKRSDRTALSKTRRGPAGITGDRSFNRGGWNTNPGPLPRPLPRKHRCAGDGPSATVRVSLAADPSPWRPGGQTQGWVGASAGGSDRAWDVCRAPARRGPRRWGAPRAGVGRGRSRRAAAALQIGHAQPLGDEECHLPGSIEWLGVTAIAGELAALAVTDARLNRRGLGNGRTR
jgi:hypothetical protein